MSSYANGCMTVVLPEEHIGEFERFFDQENENSFLNTEITLTDSENVDRAGYQKRIYDISCNTSLEACLIETEEYDIRDVCFELGIAELDIDARNDEEDFNESINFNDKERVCHYYTDSWVDGHNIGQYAKDFGERGKEMFDSRMSVVLPEDKADEFMNLFYPNNMDGFNVEEREEHDSYTNSHGLALRNISFQPRTGLLYDLVYGLGTREKSLKAVCQEYGVKRLTMYRLDTNSGYEESVTYDKKNGVKYQDRNAFPLPENEYLGDDETIESEAEAE